MIYGSVCSGIEAATAAWHPLGWKAAWYSEIEPFPSAVLAHHYPETPNLGDMTKFKEWPYARGSVDLLVGGTPCQSFSVAGLRKGLDDPRGNLMLTFGAIADHLRPRWLVWENVPGVLSSGGRRDFGSFLGMLGLIGYGFAYRILDAQFYGVAQRRRRVFVVGYFGDWRPAAAVLFESEGLRRDPPPSRKTGQDASRVAGTLASSGGGMSRPAGNCNELDFCVPVAPALTSSRRGVSRTGETRGQDPVVAVAHCLRGDGFDASEDGTGRGTPIVPIAFPANLSGTQAASTEDISPAMGAKNPTAVAFESRFARNGRGAPSEIVPPLKAQSGQTGKGDAAPLIAFAPETDPLAFDTTQITSKANRSNPKPGDPCHPLAAGAHPPAIVGSAVRRLTPRECERLQGFLDDYTRIPWRGAAAEDCPDGPRYKALGNSMAVPVMAWIGRRIERVESILKEEP